MHMSSTVKCAHAACQCDIPQERLDQNAKHCSDSCAFETTQKSRCACGHAPCDIEVAAYPKELESVISVGPEG